VIQTLKIHVYDLLKNTLYGRWPRRDHLEDGYTVLLPIPADMPFLLRFALEGLRHLQMPNCREIVVISDGSASDRAIRTIVAENGDKRLRCAPLTPLDRLLVNLPRGDGSANFRYFTMVLRGVSAAATDALYLHDADAFWLEEGGVETQYRAFRERDMYTLGVTSRTESIFKERGFEIPGTWELMFSNAWVRRWSPVDIKGGWHRLPDGQWGWFDNLLFVQYLDYPSGKIGVMASPPSFIHFFATITEYRTWLGGGRAHGTEDKLFSLLLLSLLAEAVPGARRDTPLPRPDELARGLRDPSAKITYFASTAPKRYAAFRRGIEALCSSPAFTNDVAQRIRDAIVPFDEHFSALGSQVSVLASGAVDNPQAR
jgi:hypothetical protein